MKSPVAVDLDGALCDTRPLWRDWLQAASAVLGFDPAELPDDRARAAAELDRRGTGNWRVLLERWSEERAPVYFRRASETSAALRGLADLGCRIGVFTDAPEPLARIAVAHLGGDRRVSDLEAGTGALERLVAALGPEAIVVRTPAELSDLAQEARHARSREWPPT